jgi:hypothetical protein
MQQREEKMGGRLEVWVGLAFLAVILVTGCQTATVAEKPAAAKGSSEASPLGKTIVGETTWPKWRAETGWESADWYRLPPEKVASLKKLQQQSQATFVIFGGSWCKDTHQQLGMIMAVLEQAGAPAERVKLYGVDRSKTEPSGTAAKHSIQRVPTVVILSKTGEMGRIVEYPQTTWEDDMIRILSKK